jgi:hypothetical protein
MDYGKFIVISVGTGNEWGALELLFNKGMSPMIDIFFHTTSAIFDEDLCVFFHTINSQPSHTGNHFFFNSNDIN